MSEDNDQYDYVVEIYDGAGELIDSFDDIDMREFAFKPNAFRYMDELYVTVRRTAMGTDKAIDIILSELDKG